MKVYFENIDSPQQEKTFILYAICKQYQTNFKLELHVTLSLLVSTAYPELGTAQPQLVYYLYNLQPFLLFHTILDTFWLVFFKKFVASFGSNVPRSSSQAEKGADLEYISVCFSNEDTKSKQFILFVASELELSTFGSATLYFTIQFRL